MMEFKFNIFFIISVVFVDSAPSERDCNYIICFHCLHIPCMHFLLRVTLVVLGITTVWDSPRNFGRFREHGLLSSHKFAFNLEVQLDR